LPAVMEGNTHAAGNSLLTVRPEMQCDECKVNYPTHLVVRMQIRQGLFCGICALDITRRFRNNPSYQFTGVRSRKLLQQCLEWHRERNEAVSVRTH
jgi:hypothetical protein